MISGMAVALKALDPRIKIFGAEPANAADAADVRYVVRRRAFWHASNSPGRLNRCPNERGVCRPKLVAMLHGLARPSTELQPSTHVPTASRRVRL